MPDRPSGLAEVPLEERGCLKRKDSCGKEGYNQPAVAIAKPHIFEVQRLFSNVVFTALSFVNHKKAGICSPHTSLS